MLSLGAVRERRVTASEAETRRRSRAAPEENLLTD